MCFCLTADKVNGMKTCDLVEIEGSVHNSVSGIFAMTVVSIYNIYFCRKCIYKDVYYTHMSTYSKFTDTH